MTTDSTNQKTTHSKLRLVGLLMATALLATACGGGGGGVAAPPAGSPPTGSPPAASDVVTMVDIQACPAADSYEKNTTWYTKCLVGKRLVGKDAITSEACELRLKAGGVFEYVKNGVVLSTTKPVSEWKLSNGDASLDGLYTNSLIASSVGSNRTFKASLFGGYNPTPTTYLGYSFDITVLENTLSPNDLGSNEDTVSFDVPDGKTENCKLNNI
jgi:hypothetical protein